MRKVFWLVLVALAMPAASWAQTGPLVVSFNPSSTTVNVGQTFNVNIVANIPDPVLGWGLDVTFNPSFITQTAAVVSDPPWTAVPPSPDGDNLAGLAFPEVSGSGVVLSKVDPSVKTILSRI